MIKSVFSLVAIILGAFIGAGFCSGKEIFTYFARYGKISITLSLICGVLLCLLMWIFLVTGKYLDTNKSKFGNTFLNMFSVIASLVIIASMLAGSVCVGINLNDNLVIIIYIATALLTFVICSKGFNGVDKVNLTLIPLIIIILLVTCLLSKGADDWVVGGNIVGGILSCLNYLSFNLLLIGMLLIKIAPRYSTKEIKWGTIFSSGIITLFLILICVTLNKNSSQILSSDMPILSLAFSVSRGFGIVCGIVIWLGLLTTLISSTYATLNFMPKTKHNSLLYIVLILGVGAVISVMGFSFIVNYLYWIIGVMGIVYTAYVVGYYLKYVKKK